MSNQDDITFTLREQQMLVLALTQLPPGAVHDLRSAQTYYTAMPHPDTGEPVILKLLEGDDAAVFRSKVDMLLRSHTEPFAEEGLDRNGDPVDPTTVKEMQDAYNEVVKSKTNRELN